MGDCDWLHQSQSAIYDLWPPDWTEQHIPILTKVLLDNSVLRPFKCLCLNFWPTYSSHCGAVFLITYFQYHFFKYYLLSVPSFQREYQVYLIYFLYLGGVLVEKRKRTLPYILSA